eukprot:364992-Chlamydomonas_euryale.AAC.2
MVRSGKAGTVAPCGGLSRRSTRTCCRLKTGTVAHWPAPMVGRAPAAGCCCGPCSGVATGGSRAAGYELGSDVALLAAAGCRAAGPAPCSAGRGTLACPSTPAKRLSPSVSLRWCGCRFSWCWCWCCTGGRGGAHSACSPSRRSASTTRAGTHDTEALEAEMSLPRHRSTAPRVATITSSCRARVTAVYSSCRVCSAAGDEWCSATTATGYSLPWLLCTVVAHARLSCHTSDPKYVTVWRAPGGQPGRGRKCTTTRRSRGDTSATVPRSPLNTSVS